MLCLGKGGRVGVKQREWQGGWAATRARDMYEKAPISGPNMMCPDQAKEKKIVLRGRGGVNEKMRAQGANRRQS